MAGFSAMCDHRTVLTGMEGVRKTALYGAGLPIPDTCPVSGRISAFADRGVSGDNRPDLMPSRRRHMTRLPRVLATTAVHGHRVPRRSGPFRTTGRHNPVRRGIPARLAVRAGIDHRVHEHTRQSGGDTSIQWRGDLPDRQRRDEPTTADGEHRRRRVRGSLARREEDRLRQQPASDGNGAAPVTPSA
jgi:hypothetical protein